MQSQDNNEISESSAASIKEKINAAKARNDASRSELDPASSTNLEHGEEAKVASEQASSPQQTNTLAILALVFAFIIPPVGLILGIIAPFKIKKSNEGGRGLAISGIVVSIVVMLIGLILGTIQVLTDSQNSKSKNESSAAKNTTTNNSNNKSKNYSTDENKAISIVDSYLKNIKSGNYQEAWNLLGPELQKEYNGGQADFVKEVTDANLRLINNWDIENVNTNQAGDRITLDGKANFRTSNPNGSIKFGFYKDNDGSIKMYLWDIRPL